MLFKMHLKTFRVPLHFQLDVNSIKIAQFGSGQKCPALTSKNGFAK